jgi:hypothetical protein
MIGLDAAQLTQRVRRMLARLKVPVPHHAG